MIQKYFRRDLVAARMISVLTVLIVGIISCIVLSQFNTNIPFEPYMGLMTLICVIYIVAQAFISTIVLRMKPSISKSLSKKHNT